MAELIIQNPSITSGDFSFSGDAITAIAGHPVAGIGGGGTQSDYVYVPSFNNQTGDITFTLGVTGSEGKGPWHISGAQGPAGENGKSLSAEYEEDSVNRQTQVKIGQIDGSVQTTFNLPWGVNGTNGANGTSLSAKTSTITGGHRVEIWEKGASQYDDSFDVMDGQDGNDGYSPVVSIDDSVQGQHTITITDKTHQAEPHEFIVYDGTDGDNGDPGYAPIVTTKTVTGQGHNNSGTEITITYGEAGAQTAVYTAWNGNDGAGATVNLLGGDGIKIDASGSDYTLSVSADYSGAAVDSAKNWVNAQGYVQSGALNPENSISGKWCYNQYYDFGLKASAESALADVSKKLGIPESLADGYYLWNTYANDWLDIEEAGILTTGKLSATNGLSGKYIGGQINKYQFGLATSGIDPNKQYAWTTSGWEPVQTGGGGTVYNIIGNNGVSAKKDTVNDRYEVGLSGDYVKKSGDTVIGELVLSGANYDNYYLKVIRQNIDGHARFGLGGNGGAVIKADNGTNNAQMLIKANSTSGIEILLQKNSNEYIGNLIPMVVETSGWVPSGNDYKLHIVLDS